MSTVIERFFILNTTSMEEIDRVNEIINKITIKLSKENAYKQIVDNFVKWENEKEIKDLFADKYASISNIDLFTIIDEKHTNRKSTLPYFFYDVYHLAEKYQSNCSLNLSTNIYFKTQGDKTFYRIWNNAFYNDLMKKVLKEVDLIEYNYWDQTDRPDNISKKEWEKRRDEYEILFANSNNFDAAMNVKLCKCALDLVFGSDKYYKKICERDYPEDTLLIEKLEEKKFNY